MPNYDFQCESCGLNFWKSVPLGTTEFPCGQCEKTAKKVFSAPAVHFSGKGFYRTDSQKTCQNSCGCQPDKKSENG